MPKSPSYKKRKTSVIAECRECSKSWDYYRTAQQLAYEHHKTTGHRVVGEVVTSFEYDKARPTTNESMEIL